MKNLKNTLIAMGLAAILGVNSVTTNASVTNENPFKGTKNQCSNTNNGILGQFAGVIIFGMTGIMLPQSLSLGDESCGTDEEIVPTPTVLKGYRKC
ncbi:MAG TPA: hypothetical protein VF596_13030 [Pyrinomonadaceae bacterium]|jgi:hypothetical protein